MNKTQLLRRCLSAVVSFILCALVFLLTLCVTVLIICSEKYINTVTFTSGYIDSSYSSLQKDLEDITIPSGLPLDFFHDKIDKTVYEERTVEAFSCDLSGNTPSFTTDTITEEFYALAYDYALTQNLSVSNESKEALMGFATECTEYYISYVNPSAVKFVLSNFTIIKKLVGYATGISFLLSVAATTLLYFLCRGKDFKKHLIFILSGNVLYCAVIPAVLLISEEIRKIAITAEALFSLTVGFIEGMLLILIIFAIIYALIITALILIKKKNSNKNF